MIAAHKRVTLAQADADLARQACSEADLRHENLTRAFQTKEVQHAECLAENQRLRQILERQAQSAKENAFEASLAKAAAEEGARAQATLLHEARAQRKQLALLARVHVCSLLLLLCTAFVQGCVLKQCNDGSAH